MSHDLSSADNAFAPPPNAFPPAPRTVRLRFSPYVRLIFLLVFGVPGATLFTLWFGGIALTKCGHWFGTSVPGRVTDKSTYGRGQANYRIYFTYRLDEQDFNSRMNVDIRSSKLVKIGDEVQVRVWRAFPDLSASIEDPKLAGSWNDAVLSGFVLLWNGVTILLALTWYRRDAIRRKLARFGTPVLGRVIAKRARRRQRIWVTYRYPCEDGEHEVDMYLHTSFHGQIKIGQFVTVLYDPANPDVSVIYRCGEYEVVGVG